MNTMFTVTHFRSEFIQQRQAMILRRVTMIQFMLVICLTALGVGLFQAPFWLSPLFICIGYIAGYSHNGEVLIKRFLAYATVWLRQIAGMPRVVNIHSEWELVRRKEERQQVRGALAAKVVME
ncbi:MAG: hypothetical protein H6657_00025 [Ardenticatenaceae bacterium]|nr:hypothetical protein [Ardenticatenaceae bacterium]